MILLDKPFVSDFLIDTIHRNNYEIINTKWAAENCKSQKLNILSDEEALRQINSGTELMFYTNSENSIEWIEQNLPGSTIAAQIRLFKDKIAFRNLLKDLYPDYYYQGIEFNHIDEFDIKSVPLPFIIKPAVGFLSLGVYKVDRIDEWNEVRENIKREVSEVEKLFPKEVLNTQMFIIEECIPGDEFAIDCYFDKKGELVILNILKHLFGSDKDVSDRVYITSKEIIETYKPQVENFLKLVGNKANLQNFPCHVEVRIDESGNINPIEVNPLRFGGLCTTADLTWYAYGFNSYEFLLNQKQPDWNSILNNMTDDIFSLVLLDNSTGKDGNDIECFYYDNILEQLETTLELRKFDYTKYPLFGYLFCKTRSSNQKELIQILKSDLKEFIKIKNI